MWAGCQADVGQLSEAVVEGAKPTSGGAGRAAVWGYGVRPMAVVDMSWRFCRSAQRNFASVQERSEAHV